MCQIIAFSAVTIVLSTAKVQAAAYNYTNITGNWSTTANWNPPNNGTYPNSFADTISFSNQGGSGRNLTQDIVGGVSVGGITYTNTSGAGNRQIILTNGLTLGNDGAGPGFVTVQNTSTGTAASKVIYFTGAASLTLADDVKFITTAPSNNVNGAIQFHVPIDGAGNITFNSSSAISSTNSSSPGAFYLNRNSSFDGDVLVERGLVVINAFDGSTPTTTPFGDTDPSTGNVITIGSAGNSAGLLSREATALINNKIIIAPISGSETRTFGASSNSTFTVSTGDIDLQGNLDLRAGNTSATAVQTYTGNIDGMGGINKTFTAIAQLSGTNTYSGNTTVSAGTLLFANKVSLYNDQQGPLGGFWNDSKIAVNANAVLGFNVGGAGEFTDPDIANLSSLGTATGGFKAGSLLGLNPTVPTYTYANTIADTNGGANSIGFAKLGSNTLELTAANTYTGPTTFYAGTLALSGGDNRLSTASSLAFNPGNSAGSVGTFDMGSTNQTLSQLTLNTAALATPSTSTLNITGTGTLALGANDLSIGAGGSDSLDNATNFHQVLNMSGLSNFVFNNNTKNVHFGLNWVAGSRATKQTNVATVNFATNNTITASTLGFADNGGGAGGGKTTVNLGQTNVWNIGTYDSLFPDNNYLSMGVSRADLNMQFATGLVNPTITIRAADGTSAMPRWIIGQHNDNSGTRVWDDVVDFSGGITDALIKTMVIGSAESSGPTRNGTVNGTFILGAGNVTITDSLTIGAFRPTLAGNGTDSTMRGNGTFRLDNAAGTLTVPTILLADAPTAAVVGAVTQTTTGVLDLRSGTVRTTTITKGSTVGNITGGVVQDPRIDFTGGTIQNTSGADLAINDVMVQLLSGTGPRIFDASGINTIALNAGTVVSGVGALTKAGSGTMTFAGVNTHTGGNIVNDGLLKVLTGATFSGAAGQLSTNGTGIADVNGTNQTVGFMDGNGGKILNSVVATNSILTVGGGDASGGEYFGSITAGTANPAGDYNLNGTVDAADYIVWRKTIGTPAAYNTWRANFGATSSPGGDFTLVKTGLGTVTLSGTNTYTGTTTVQAGALVFGTPASLYNGQVSSWNTANIVVEADATLGFRVGGAGNFSELQIATLHALGSATGGYKTGSSLGISPSVASYTYTSAIGNAAGGANVTGLTKLGPNTLFLSSANTYGGNTQVAEGVLSVTQIGNVGAVSGQLGAPATSVEGAIRLGSAAGVTGTLRYTGGGETTDRDFVAWGAAGAKGEIESAGAGPLVLTGNLSSGNAGAKTLTLTGASTGNNTVSGTISDGSDVFSLAKAGTGNWVVTNANTYTGTTTVNGGVLKITGSHTGAGVYNVAVVAGSTAQLILDGGPGGSISGPENIYVGTDGGNGTFTQVDGTVTAGSTGSFQELYVGFHGGTGLYDLQSGSLSMPTEGYINVGRDGGTGTFNNSASVSITRELRVGAKYESTAGTSTGTFNNIGTATVQAGDIVIGAGGFVESNGTYNQLGAGTTNVTGVVYVGGNGIGTLNMGDGTITIGGYISNGRSAGSAGTSNISGGSLSVTGDYNVGDYGMGTLNMTGGSISAGGLFVAGYQAGSSGNATISGGATVAATLDVRIGNSGTGTLTLSNGAITTGGNGFYIGTNASGNGTVTMTGGSVTAGVNLLVPGGTADIRIGSTGTGVLHHSAGTIQSEDWAYVSVNGGSNGTYNLSGTGVIKPGDNMAVGYNTSTNGTMNMTGGSVEMTGNDPSLASSTSFGTGNFTVGREGTGTLNMSGGTINTSVTVVNTGAVGSDTDTFNSASASVAYNTLVPVAGGPLRYALDGNLYVGERRGTGTMIQSGGTTNVGANVFVGGVVLVGADLVGGKGTLTISGGEMHVGQLPMGLNQSPTGGDFVLGSPATTPVSEATVNLTGGLLDVAHTDITDTYGGNIASGGNTVGVGTFAFNFTGGTLKVRRWNAAGPFGGSLGNLKQNGLGSLLDITGNDTDLLQGSSYELGVGTATIGSGRKLTAAGVINTAGTGGVINVGQGGTTATLDVAAGAVDVDSLVLDNGSVIAGGGVTVQTALTGTGTTSADLALSTGSTTTIDINSITDFDKITVGGLLKYGGNLVMDLDPTYFTTILPSQTFQVFTFGSFDNTTPFTVETGWLFDASTGIVTYDGGAANGSSLDSTGAVPEPTSLALFAMSAIGLFGGLSRRRRS